MRTYLVILAGLMTAISCNDGSRENAPEGPFGKKGTPRNLSITKANAYSNLFLDSPAMEHFIREQKLNDTIAFDMRNFYNARNYQYAWFASDGLTEQALAFRNLYDYTADSNNARKKLDRTLDALAAEDSMRIGASDANIRKTELLLTWRYINYAWKHFPREKDRQVALEKFIPAKKYSLEELTKATLDEEAPHENYKALQDQLQLYQQMAEQGGWDSIPRTRKKLKPGSHDPAIVLIKKRLQAAGQYKRDDSSSVYTPELQTAVAFAQTSFGLKPNGVIDQALVHEWNVPVNKRIAQLLLNLERMRWMPAEPSGKLIWVNIPEFKLYVREGNQTHFNMDIVVGEEGHSTVMFSGELNQVVFSPYWNIPTSIVKKEILPKLEADPDYLAKNSMEITREEEGVPVIRQLPGGPNQLGKIKFLFPNSYNIYFHDTPFKELFNKDKRAFSHGCIRLKEPVKLAEYLLQDQPQWTPNRIDSAMNSGKEKFVRVKDPVPVLIYYYTAWVDENKLLHFRDDIYGHDAKLARKLFTVPAAAPLALRKHRKHLNQPVLYPSSHSSPYPSYLPSLYPTYLFSADASANRIVPDSRYRDYTKTNSFHRAWR